MNKTTVIVGGIIIIVLIGAVVYLSKDSLSSIFNMSNATSTPSVATSTETGTVVPGGGESTAGKPNPTTNATVAPTDTTAVVTGTVVPNGAITTYWYEYGTTQSLGLKTAAQIVGSGYVAIKTPGYITGLTKGTTYYFRLVAENAFGRVSASQNTVTTTTNTPTPIPGGTPTAKTLSVSNITRTSASLAGEVNPNKAATQYWFEYGRDNNFGNTTAFVSVGDGNLAINASAALTNLNAGTTYHYRMNAQNQFGTVNGAILTFKTSAPAANAPTVPAVSTRSANDIEKTSVTLRAAVDPNNAETMYWFEYSTDSLLGSALIKSTAQKSAGSGTNLVNVETDVTGLASNTTYYARAVAQNSQGIVRGEKVSFKTK